MAGRITAPRNDDLESAVGILQLVRFGIRFTEGFHGDGLDLLLSERTVLTIGFHGGDGVDNVHALGNCAESGILAVQEITVLMHDEELASAGIGGLGSSHGQHTALMSQVVLHAVEPELALDAVAGTAHAGTLGAAALNHKAGDDTVKDQTVIEAFVDQRDEVAHRLGRYFGIQLSNDLAAVFHFDGYDGICHLSHVPFFHGAFHLTFCVAFGRVFSFIIELFAFGQCNFNLDTRASEINRQGN